jgi:hypothetical protein
VRIVLPQLTEERRKEYVKLAKSKAEEGRVAVRAIAARRRRRQEAREGQGSRRGRRPQRREAPRRLTKKYVEQIDELLKPRKRNCSRSDDRRRSPAARRSDHAGRDLPAAIAVGVGLVAAPWSLTLAWWHWGFIMLVAAHAVAGSHRVVTMPEASRHARRDRTDRRRRPRW